MERVFEFSVSDFAAVVETTMFVDHTLMIRDIFSESSRILVTAPRRFGKSTNIDMVRRFLEIEVDAIGSPKPGHTTKNYRLFKDNNLDIYKEEEFFNQHFAKYPVMHIDCEPLGDVHDFVNMLDVFRTIVTKTFNQHVYLLNVAKFGIDNVYFDDQLIKNTDVSDLVRSFEYLSKILYRQFGKAVFVLIDDCDAFINSLLLKNNNMDAHRIIYFIKATLDNLLRRNQYVGRALLTGVLPVAADRFLFRRLNIDCHYFLGSDRFFKYYGLTSYNLDKVLNKLITDDEERNKTKQTINKYYAGYTVHEQTVQVYNIWSVLQYLRKREIQNYSHNCDCVTGLKLAFEITQIRNKIEQLLLGNKLLLDTSRPLSTTDILQLNKTVTTSAVGDTSCILEENTDTFLQLLCHFGYLCVNKILDWGVVSLKIPNEEIHQEFVKILGDIRTLDRNGEAHTDGASSATVTRLQGVSEKAVKGIEERDKAIPLIRDISHNCITNIADEGNIENLTFRRILMRVRKIKVLKERKRYDSLKSLLNGDTNISMEIHSLLRSYYKEKFYIPNWDTVVVEELRNKKGKNYRTALYTLLCYFGLLVITRKSEEWVELEILNRCRLVKVISQLGLKFNCHDEYQYANNIMFALDSFENVFFDSDKHKIYENIGKALVKWYVNGLYEWDVLGCLFVTLLSGSGSCEILSCIPGFDLILLENKHQVAVYIAVQSAKKDTEEGMKSAANKACEKIKNSERYSEMYRGRGKLALGIGYCESNIIATAFSYWFGSFNSLDDPYITLHSSSYVGP